MRIASARKLLSWLLVAAVSVPVVAAPMPTANAALTSDAFEACLLDRINTDRIANGRTALEMATDLNPAVRAFSEKVAGESDLRHMTSTERDPILPPGTYTWGENVAWHSNPDLPDCSTIHNMLINSAGHRANILSSSMSFVALGVFIDGSGTWVTELFFDSTRYEPPDPVGEGRFVDDDTSIFETDIEKLAAAGITHGCNPPTNNRYCPNNNLTRGEMAAMLVRALGL